MPVILLNIKIFKFHDLHYDAFSTHDEPKIQKNDRMFKFKLGFYLFVFVITLLKLI